MIAKGKLKRLGLVLVTQGRRGAVCIDVLHILRIEATVAQRIDHAAPRSIAIRRGDVVGIRTHAVAREFTINARAALPGMLVLFEHEYAGALAEHKTVPVPIPGPRCRGRIVIARRKRAHRREAAHAQGRNRRFGATGDHDVGIAVFDQACGIPDRMQARRAGRHHRVGGPLQAEHDRELSRNQVDEGGGNEKRRNPARSALKILCLRFLDALKPADAGPDDRARAFGV